MSPPGAASAACVIRAPNHLGDLVMALPALAAADADVVVVSGLAPLAALALDGRRITPLDRRRRGFLAAARLLRRRHYERGVLLPPSFSSALLFRAGGVRGVRGLDTDARRFLLADAVPRAAIRGMHRASVYALLVQGMAPPAPPVPRLTLPAELVERGRRFVGARAGLRTVGLFPGSNAPSRRWDAERFAEVARRLAAAGDRVIVFGGPTETELTRAVAADHAVDAGGRTDLPLLAASLAACDILVTNDSGPLHLAAAVGTATVSLWGAGNPAVTGVHGDAHQLLRRSDLACVPCVKNVCPRTGPGDLLPSAERECLKLIQVGDVLARAAPPR